MSVLLTTPPSLISKKCNPLKTIEFGRRVFWPIKRSCVDTLYIYCFNYPSYPGFYHYYLIISHAKMPAALYLQVYSALFSNIRLKKSSKCLINNPTSKHAQFWEICTVSWKVCHIVLFADCDLRFLKMWYKVRIGCVVTEKRLTDVRS